MLFPEKVFVSIMAAISERPKTKKLLKNKKFV